LIEYMWNAARQEPQDRAVDLKKAEHSDYIKSSIFILK
jgi:hypothetical protein